jgi:hypothetical protein
MHAIEKRIKKMEKATKKTKELKKIWPLEIIHYTKYLDHNKQILMEVGQICETEAIVILDDIPSDYYKIEPEDVEGIIAWWRKRIDSHKYLRENVHPRNLQIYGSREEIIELLKNYSLTEIEKILKERHMQEQWAERQEKARARFGTKKKGEGG